MARFIDIHVLQTLPPSNPNRDDTGALVEPECRGGEMRPSRFSVGGVK